MLPNPEVLHDRVGLEPDGAGATEDMVARLARGGVLVGLQTGVRKAKLCKVGCHVHGVEGVRQGKAESWREFC